MDSCMQVELHGNSHSRPSAEVYISGAGRSLTEAAREVSSQEAAEAFIHDFTRQYGEAGPHWEASSWQAAAARAHQRFCFTFVYLHSPSHVVGGQLNHTRSSSTIYEAQSSQLDAL